MNLLNYIHKKVFISKFEIFSCLVNYLNFCTQPPDFFSLNRVRNVLRGNRIMRRDGNHTLIQDIYSQFTETPIKSSSYLPFVNLISLNDDKNDELSYRQYLLFKLIGTRLSGTLLAHFFNQKTIKHPLPGEWINILKKNKIKISKFKSYFLFYIFSIKQFVLAIIECFRLNGVNFIYLFQKKINHKSMFIFLDYLKSVFLLKMVLLDIIYLNGT